MSLLSCFLDGRQSDFFSLFCRHNDHVFVKDCKSTTHIIYIIHVGYMVLSKTFFKSSRLLRLLVDDDVLVLAGFDCLCDLFFPFLIGLTLG
jgi:hypothetical protein